MYTNETMMYHIKKTMVCNNNSQSIDILDKIPYLKKKSSARSLMVFELGGI